MDKDNVTLVKTKEIEQKNTPSYFQQEIIEKLGFSEEELTVTARFPEEKGKFLNIPLICECEEGFRINYVSPDGYISQYTNSNGKQRNFERIRLKEPVGNQKYKQPKGSGIYPFITPLVLDSYQQNKKIETLFVVEGEKKALVAAKYLDLPFIAIPGINSFTDKDSNEIHPYIGKIIEKCNVKQVVLVFDSDWNEISEESESDLFKRPFSFYTAVKQFREHTKKLNIDLYFSPIKSEFLNIAKGLDDLIMEPKTKREQLKKELTNLATGQKKYLESWNISDNSISKIYSEFGLDSVKIFHEKHKSKLGENEFIFKNTKYRFDEKDGKLKASWYGEALNYIRIGTNYKKKAFFINAKGKPEETHVDWSVAVINSDYGNNKEFIRQIKKYDVSCNVPDHTENFQKEIIIEKDGIRTIAYNMYYKLNHSPQKGDFPNIEKFLKHIGNSQNLKGESLYPFLLDWLQICYINPTQMLPVLCLVSRERNTGKSTFLQFLRLVFCENATILDNERFTGKFTSHYITKLIIGVDESFIPVDQQHMKERIKNLATGKRQWMEAKGQNAQEIDFFGKLVLCSNNENNFMQIDVGENRHCVLKINPLGSDDTRILEKMEKEIPAFLYFLQNRELHYKEEKSRSWFAFDVFETQTMLEVQERTKDRLEREFEELIRDTFNSCDQLELLFTAKDIAMELSNYLTYKVAPTRIKDMLRDKGYTPEKNQRYDLYSPNGGSAIPGKVGTPYRFFREDWIESENDNSRPPF